MSQFNRFQEKNIKYREAGQKADLHFLFAGTNSTIIKNGTTEIQAAVVNEQEKDKAYIYTNLNDSLPIGSVWYTNQLHMLVTEEIYIVFQPKWRKYLSLICNFEINDVWGAFYGPEKTYINLVNRDDAILESLQKPILVLPANILDFGDTIVLKNRPWLIQEMDALSHPGLVYYSLTSTTISKSDAAAHAGQDTFIIKKEENIVTPIIIEPEQETGTTDNVYRIGNNIDITLSTVDGYFKFDNKQIIIKKRNNNEVIFCLPFGVNEVKVQTKEGTEIIERKYMVM